MTRSTSGERLDKSAAPVDIEDVPGDESGMLRRQEERGADDILVVGGGVIPDADCAQLKSIGVRELMLQDTRPDEIVAMVRRVVAARGRR